MDTSLTSPTASLIRDLNKQGIDKLSLVIRHSARNYDQDIKMEPFMCLTPKGRDMALALGATFPENLSLEFFSSYIGRCIETAYLLDKGFVKKTGGLTRNNRVAEHLSPFYVRHLKKVVDLIIEQDTVMFIRNWIDGHIDESILMNSGQAARRMLRFMVGGLMESEKNILQVSVTHDWNMYLLKEYGLGLPHEDFGKIDYLEGVVVFRKKGKTYIANHQKDPVLLTVE
ncbi:MAG: histidine phosphatase family protein [Proteobacteria bacterium]|nr:histidine phosphatase family protein [Pseudomonadota bacterium]